jgi:magnesium transporter
MFVRYRRFLMSAELVAVTMLNERFLVDYPLEAARTLESLPAQANISLLQSRSPAALLRAWQALSPDRAAAVLDALPADAARQLLNESDPQVSNAALAYLSTSRRDALLAAQPDNVARELRELAAYRQGSVGYVMDPRVGTLGVALTVADAIERLRSIRLHGLRELYVVNEQMHLVGQIDVEDLALSGRERPIREIMRGVAVVAHDSDPVAKAMKALRELPLNGLPVVNEQGRFKGVIRLPALLAAMRHKRKWWWPTG